MLIIGAIGLTAAFLIAALAVITDSPALAIIGVFGVVTSFATGFSPLTYVVCAEVFPSRLRAKAMSLAIFTTRSIAGIISLLVNCCVVSIVQLTAACIGFQGMYLNPITASALLVGIGLAIEVCPARCPFAHHP